MEQNLESYEKIIQMLDAINESLTDDVIASASPEELAEYFEVLTKIRAKIKNIK